ncbi:MAG: hypothetical protein IT379_05640 [Deltaproteobacteria bacterium]|nr:hypothetical protein [Deltaproteobacteria bacterium]
MRTGTRLGMVFGLALSVAGCGDDDGDTDSGTPPPPPPADMGPREDGDPPPPPPPTFELPAEVPVAERQDSMMPADFSCLGMRTRPMGEGMNRMFDMQVNDFQTGDPVPEVTVQFFPDNIVLDTCSGDCLEGESSEMGVVGGRGEIGGWFAYRVLPKAGPTPPSTVVGAVQYNEPTPAEGETWEGNSVSEATLRLIPTVFGFRRAAGTGLVAGTVFDCNGDAVRGGVIRMFLPDGSEVVEGMAMSDPHHEYFDGEEFPSPDQIHTNTDGLYASANVPPSGTEPMRIEAWGRLESGGPAVLLGCEEGRTFADTVTIMNLEPLRSDAPDGCGAQ